MRKLIIILVCFAAACNPAKESNQGFRLTGTITGIKADSVYLENTSNDALIAAKVTNNTFTFSGLVPYPEVYSLYLVKTPQLETFFRIFIENSEMTISGNADSVNALKVTGSKSQVQYEGFQKSIQPIRDEMGKVDRQVNAAMESNQMDLADSLSEVYNNTAHKRLEAVYDYARQNSSSSIIPFITSRASIDAPDADLIRKIISASDTTVNKPARFAGILDMLHNLSKVNVGSISPDFTFTDRNGKTISAADLRGKVVLLDFWAAWCGPCRKNHPDLVDVYKNYKGKDFELISISLDKNKKNWEEAMLKDKLTWTQSCDLQGAQGEIPKTFGIEIIPAGFVIGRDGRIEAKDVHRRKLRATLDRLLARK